MNSNFLPWIFFIPSLLSLLFYLGALIFVISNRNRHRQAAGMAMLGVGMMFLLHVVGTVAPVVMSHLFDTDSWVLYNGVLQIVLTVARLGALGLVFAAVFVGRQPYNADQESYSAQGYINADDNPYVPPQSR